MTHLIRAIDDFGENLRKAELLIYARNSILELGHDPPPRELESVALRTVVDAAREFALAFRPYAPRPITITEFAQKAAPEASRQARSRRINPRGKA